jgi:hypothetical protein
MVEGRDTAIQRIQVGVIGLVVVLLFVSLANMILDRAADTNLAAGATADAAAAETATQDANAPDEPLAELGAAPVVEATEENNGAAKVKGNNNIKPKN